MKKGDAKKGGKFVDKKGGGKEGKRAACTTRRDSIVIGRYQLISGRFLSFHRFVGHTIDEKRPFRHM